MNAFSNLFIYKNCSILKDKNFFVDSIGTYLDTIKNEAINKLTQDDFQELIPIKAQFIKPLLKQNLVIDLSQTIYSDAITSGQYMLNQIKAHNINYLKVENIDVANNESESEMGFTLLYYFITSVKWGSENSIILELEMDVINTLIANQFPLPLPYLRRWLKLSPKTTILRQHKNRYEKVNNVIRPIIDFYSENIFPTLFKTKESIMHDIGYDESTEKTDNNSWYLIYRSQQNPSEHPESPIDVFVCSDEEKIVAGSPTGYSGTRDPFAENISLAGTSWFVYGSDGTPPNTNVGATISFTARNNQEVNLTLTANMCVVIGYDFIEVLNTTSSGSTIEHEYLPKVFKKFREVKFSNVFVVRKKHYTQSLNYLTSTEVVQFPVDSSFSSTSDKTIGSILDIDRTDPKLLKIIKLPYCPIDIIQFGYYGEGLRRISLPANWGVEDGSGTFPTLLKFKYKSLTDAFHKQLELRGSDNNLANPYQNLFTAPSSSVFGDLTKLRDDSRETKLRHSDFFQRKFVYDSFAYIFRAEFMNINSSGTDNVARTWLLDFYTTSTMNSKMFFDFPDEKIGTGTNSLKADIQDYSGILYVARNNELPIFNSAYLNYIRTGYNYDVKTKNRQLASNIVGGVLSTAGAVVSALSTGMTAGVGVAGAVALGISATTKFYNAISQTAQAEQNIEKQLKTTEMQGLSVIGGDDVDLMSEFTGGNKAKLVQYEVSEKMKKCLADLFYYCGYIANQQGIPDTSSRVWFNFVQAEIIFDYEQAFPKELLEELKTKFREGITFLHKNTIDGTDMWNFAQDKENWEKLV